MSQDIKRQTECEKSPGRREEQCLSNTERVASHICPCRVCEGEREREREGGCSGHSSFSLGRPCPLRFVREKFPKSHLSVCLHARNYCPAKWQDMLKQVFTDWGKDATSDQSYTASLLSADGCRACICLTPLSSHALSKDTSSWMKSGEVWSARREVSCFFLKSRVLQLIEWLIPVMGSQSWLINAEGKISAWLPGGFKVFGWDEFISWTYSVGAGQDSARDEA